MACDGAALMLPRHSTRGALSVSGYTPPPVASKNVTLKKRFVPTLPKNWSRMGVTSAIAIIFYFLE